MAVNLRERIKWHAAQKLAPSALKSGFLSTFRLSLLSLNDFPYCGGDSAINAFMDKLSVEWVEAPTRADAERLEAAEFAGPYRYPINIRGNEQPELSAFVKYLKRARSAYRKAHAKQNENPAPDAV